MGKSKLRKLISIFRFNKISKKREYRANLTGITNLFVKGFTTLVGLISLPITSQYLGAEKFGLWLILTMAISWSSACDLGISSSITGLLARSNGECDRDKSKEIISTSISLLFLISFALVPIALLIVYFFDPSKLFNLSNLALEKELKISIFLCMGFIIIKIPFSVSGRLFDAFQEGYYYQVWSGISCLVSFLSLILSIFNHAGLVILTLALCSSLLLGELFSTIHFFVFRYPNLVPSILNFSWLEARSLLKVGIQFWVAQIAAILIFQTDLLIVARLFSVSDVAIYGIVLKLYTLITYVSSSFVLPLWPAYSEALAKKEFKWISKTFKNSVLLSLTWSLGSGIFLSLCVSSIVKSWVSPDANLSISLILSMLFTSVSISIAQCIASLINGLGEIKLQTFFAPIYVISNFFLSFSLGNLLGISGVSWATGITVFTFSLMIVGVDASVKLKKLISTQSP